MTYRQAVAFVLTAACLIAGSAGAATTDWLLNQQQADGRFSGAADLANPYQATSETLLTLSVLGRDDPTAVAAGLDYLDSVSSDNTENLSRRILANTRHGRDVSLLLDQLKRRQGSDGGFGEFSGYDSTVLDTAFALQAFAAARSDDQAVVGAAIGYLLQKQSADGGFSFGPLGQSPLYVTAQASLALRAYRFSYAVSPQIEAATEFLYKNQTPSGTWPTQWETAASLLAVVPVSANSDRYTDAAASLRSEQLADGSWSADVYVTALALRALNLADRAAVAVDPTAGAFTGHVLDADDGLPLAGVALALESAPGVTTVSGTDGSFVLKDVAPGGYTVRYHMEGYLDATQQASVQAGQSVDLGAVRLVRQPEAGLIGGIITSAVDGEPVAGAVVKVAGADVQTVLTDAQGAYALAVAPGDVSIAVSIDGYDPVTAVASVAPGGRLYFAPALYPTGSAPSGPGVTVKGQLADGADGNPVAGGKARLVDGSEAATTDIAGRFQLDGLGVGEFTVELSASGYATARVDIVAPQGALVDLGTIRLSREILPVTSLVTGVVTDAANGSPVGGAEISVDGSATAVISDGQGQYRIEGVAGTEFRLTAKAFGYFSRTVSVQLAQPGAVVVDFPLERAGAADFAITSVSVAEPSYGALQDVPVSAVLANTGDAPQSVRLYAKVLNDAGQVVEQFAATEIALGAAPDSGVEIVPAGGEKIAYVLWNTKRHAPGHYWFVVQAYAADDGRLLAERGNDVVIATTSAVGGLVEFDPPIAQLAAKTQVKISARLSNRGNVPIVSATATATVVLRNEGYQQRTDLNDIDNFVTGQGLSSPRGMDTDAQGYIYVANSAANTVSRISPDGAVSEYVAGLDKPVDVDIAPQGDLYVLNANNGYVRVSADGAKTMVSTGLSGQTAIEALSDGRVLITRGDTLYEVTSDGAVNPVVKGGLAAPRGMALNSEGAVFIANSNGDSILRFAGGRLSTFVTGIPRPSGVTVDNSDNLYVTSYSENSLYRITPQGEASQVATGLSGPFDVKIAPDGDLAVSNAISNEIVKVTPAGQVSVLVAASVNQPSAYAYDGAGNLYVANDGWDNVIRTSPEGERAVVAANVNRVLDIALNDDGSMELLGRSNYLYHIATDGAKSTRVSGLRNAASMVKARDGNGLLIAEKDLSRITRVDLANQKVTYVDQRINSVLNMRTAADGTMYVLSQSGYVSRILPDTSVSRIADGLGYIRGLALDETGSVYVGRPNEKKILKIDATGNVSVAAQNLPITPKLLAVRNGNLIVGDDSRTDLYEIDGQGNAALFAGLPAYPNGDMVADGEGNLFVTHRSKHYVTRIAPDGGQTQIAVQYYPTSLMPDGQGGVYVGLRYGLVHVDAAGTAIELVSDNGIGVIYGVGRTPSGTTFAINSARAVYRYGSDWERLARYADIFRPSGMAYADTGELLILNGDSRILSMAEPGKLAHWIADGNYHHIVRESPSSFLLASNTQVARLTLDGGKISSLASGFGQIKGLALSPRGIIQVGDYSRNETASLSPDGTLIDRFAGLVTPRGLVFDDSGALLVSNAAPNGLSRVREDGRVVAHFSVPNVAWIEREADGQFILSTYGYSDAIKQLDAGGKVTSTTTLGTDPYGLVRDAAGRLLYVSNSEGVLYQLHDDGTQTALASGLANAGDVEADSAGVVHLADAGKGVVNVLNETDHSVALLHVQIPNVTRLHFADDRLYAAYNGTMVAAFGTEGRSELSTGVLSRAITGLTGDPAGRVYMSVAQDHGIYRFGVSEAGAPISVGEVVHVATAPLNGLGLDGEAVNVDFGSWTPSASGDYEVQVSFDESDAQGLSNVLHVGPAAYGQIELAQQQLMPGDRPVTAYLRVLGADSTSITRIDPDGTSLAASSYAGRIIAADSAGNIYAHKSGFVKITPDGQVSTFVSGISVTNGVAVDNEDNLYAGSGNKILKITQERVVSTLAELPSTIMALAYGPDGLLYAVDRSNRLSRVAQDGTVTPVTSLGIDNPAGLTIDAYGYFYVLNRNNHIIRISPDGSAASVYFDKATFEFEGVTVTADCSNNLLFAPYSLPSYKATGEEDTIVQLLGDTGEIRKVLYGPSIDPDMRDMDALYYDRFGQRLLIWTDLNHGKVFSFPVICGGIDSEVHLFARSDVDLTSTEPAPSAVHQTQDGLTEYVWHLSEVDNKGSQIQLNTLFKGLTEGEDRPVLSEAYLQFNNSFVPGEVVKVPLEIPSIHASSTVSMSVAVDSPVYGPDEVAAVSIDVSNGSDLPFDGTVQLEIVDRNGSLVERLPDLAVDSLPGATSSNYSAAWDTGRTLAGDYAVKATLFRSDTGGIAATAEAAFAVLPSTSPDAVVQTLVSTDKPVYEAWDQVAITGRVRNTTSNAIQLPVSAELTVAKPGGAIIFAATRLLSELYPNSYRDLAESFNLVDAVDGEYVVTLTASDTASGKFLSRSQFTFAVERTPSQALLGKVSVAAAQVPIGTANACDETVVNRGGASITGLSLTHLLFSVETGQLVGEASRVVDLAAGAENTASISIETGKLAPGAYMCVLRASIGGQTKDLASAGFAVIQAPIKFDASLGQGARGRLLVLLDGPEGRQGGDDPLGAREVAALAAQREHLEVLLRGAGWSFTVVTQAEDFARELRSGGYSVYLLQAEHVKLPDQVQKELREANFRGEGLVVAGSHDERNHRVGEALGVKPVGKEHAVGLQLLDDSLREAGQTFFATERQALRIETGTEIEAPQVLAQYLHSHRPALTRRQYGEGRNVFIGFDLVAEAARGEAAAGMLGEILLGALDDVHPADLSPFAGTVLPVRLNLANQGIATSGEVILAVPAGVSVADPGGASLENNVLTWKFTLDEAQALSVDFWLRLPPSSGPVSLEAGIYTGAPPKTQYYRSVVFGVDVLPFPGLEAVAGELGTLTASSPKDVTLKKIGKALAVARSAQQEGDVEDALDALVRASDELLDALREELQALRLNIDRVMRGIAMEAGGG